MAATSTSLSYNGFSSFKNVRISRFEHIADASPERASRGVTRHVLEGDAIVQFSGTSTEAIEQKISSLSAKLNRNGQSLAVTTVDTAGHTHSLVDLSSDDKTGPYPSIRITEIIGANNAALVQFSFEWFKTVQGGSALSIVREFVCVASFEVDAVGMTTITRNGHITLRKSSSSTPSYVEAFPPTSATPSTSGTYPYGYASTWSRSDTVPDYPKNEGNTDPTSPFPEQYRRMAAGNLYPGFRRVRQQFATDESRTRMVFQVVDQEYPRGLPAPCRLASVNYSYERMAPAGADSSSLGVKRFSATLAGPTNVAPADLLILAMRLSQKRIFWSRTSVDGTWLGPDIITHIRIGEPDMTNQNAIEFEVDAIGCAATATGVGAGASSTVLSGKPYSSPGLLTNILSALSIIPTTANGDAADPVTFTFSEASQPDAYGDFGVYRIAPSWYDPELAQASKTWDTTQVLASADKSNAVYVLPNAIFDSHYSETFTSDSQKLPLGRDNAKHRQDDKLASSESGDDETQASPYIFVEAVERRSTQTHLVNVPSQSPEGEDIVFQVRKPFVLVHQRASLVRLNKSPSREFLSRDAGSVVLHEEFITHGGASDAVNNRLMGAVHERIYTVTDSVCSSGTTFFTSGDYRQAWPNNAGDNANLTAGDDQSPGDVQLPRLATRDPVDGDPTFKYVFGAPEAWTT